MNTNEGITSTCELHSYHEMRSKILSAEFSWLVEFVGDDADFFLIDK